MRRVLPIAAALAALTMTAPTAALANHGHHHHKSRHRAHHAKVHFRHLGAASSSTTTASGTQAGTGATPTTPTAPTPENAGTVASYISGMLTLTLTDGSSVSGKVTTNTQIECVSATMPPPGDQNDDNGTPGEDDNGLGDDQSSDHGHQGPGDQGNSGDEADDQGSTGTPGMSEPPCDSSTLVAGATVRAAELRIGPGGSEFESIEVVR